MVEVMAARAACGEDRFLFIPTSLPSSVNCCLDGESSDSESERVRESLY